MRMGTFKETLKHSSVFGGANILRKGVGFLMIPVYTYYLAPSDYGILELLDLTINIISLVTAMGIGAAVIRFYHSYDSTTDRQEVFSTALISIGLGTIIVLGITESQSGRLAVWILKDGDYAKYYRVMFFAMALQTVAGVPENLLLAEKRSWIYSAISTGTFVCYLTLNILFIVILKMGVWGILVGILITKVLNTTSLFVVVRDKLKITFSANKLAKMLRFSLPLIPSSFAMFCIHYADRFFVQKYCGATELGLYSLGYKFGMIISVLVLEPFFRIWNTQRFELAKQDDGKDVLGRGFTYMLLILTAAGLAVSLYGNEAVTILAPASYEGAASIISIVALSYVFGGIASFFTLGMVLQYKTKSLASIHVFACVANIVLNSVMIPLYGITGAAVSTVMTFGGMALASLIVSQRLYKIRIERDRILKITLVLFVIYALSRYAGFSLLANIGFKTLLMFCYPLGLLCISFLKDDEKIAAKAIFEKVVLCRRGIKAK